MLFVAQERLEGFKYNIGLGGGGGSTKGEGTDMSTTKKRGLLNTFFPLCSLTLLELERFLDVLRMTKSFFDCELQGRHQSSSINWLEGGKITECKG